MTKRDILSKIRSLVIFLTQQLQNKILKTGLSNEKCWSRAMRQSAGSNFTGEYLGEFETEIENILGC
jgi:hypothetical protein